MHVNSRPPAPMGPLHLAANTLTLRTTTAAAHGPSNPPRYHKPRRVSISGASKEGATPVAPPSLVQQWTGFSPRDLMPEDTVPHSGAPNGERHPKDDATTTTDKSADEGFRPDNTTPYTRPQTSSRKHRPRRLRISSAGRWLGASQQLSFVCLYYTYVCINCC